MLSGLATVADGRFTSRRLLFFIRFVLRWTTILYLAGLCGLLIALHWYGERNWVLGLLLFAPAPGFLAPMALFAPLCLLLRQGMLVLAQVGVAAALLLGYQRYGWHAPSSEPATLRLATYNVGEGNPGEIMRFLTQERPEVALLQETGLLGQKYASANPGWRLTALSQFACLTKMPVLSARLPVVPGWHGSPVVARFEVQISGKKTALYSVHLPTPRPELQQFISRRPLQGLSEYRAFLAERNELGHALAALLALEKEPMVVAGDFNTPDHGFVYHDFTPLLTDSFAKAGQGWGFTFPADNTSRWTHGPWLRIDYIWGGPGWTPLSCKTSDGVHSQHRGVVANLVYAP